MLGVGSFCAVGALLHAWGHTPGVRYNIRAARWGYWLLVSGAGPAVLAPPTPSETRGRAIYQRQGCAYCHTLQVRMVAEEVARFGAPSASWEQRYDRPHQWATRRIGSDLTREAGRPRDDWQLAHL